VNTTISIAIPPSHPYFFVSAGLETLFLNGFLLEKTRTLITRNQPPPLLAVPAAAAVGRLISADAATRNTTKALTSWL
jgi:hypothetical protein